MFSQTTEYALRAMMFLVNNQRDGNTAVAVDRIAAHTRVPQGYLSKIMRDLVVADPPLVKSFRGPGGGFALARSAAEITIFDVVAAVDPIHRVQTCPIGDPSHTQLCALHQRLDDALAYVEHMLRSATLEELARTSAEGARGATGGVKLCPSDPSRACPGTLCKQISPNTPPTESANDAAA